MEFSDKFWIKKEEYENLLEHLPTLSSYFEKFKKTCIDMDEGTQNWWILSFLSTFSIVAEAYFQCFPKMKNAKTVFLAACKIWDKNINLGEINQHFLIEVLLVMKIRF